VEKDLYIGLMSGTSMDGIDAVLARFEQNRVHVLGHSNTSWPKKLRQQLKLLAQPGNNEIDLLGRTDLAIADHFADAVAGLLSQCGITSSQIAAIGSHGQTIRHRPELSPPFTLQIGDPNRLAERTGITVVCDFRRRDMAAGGQGAPLAPGFHAAALSAADEVRVILNLGGIANITVLPKSNIDNIIGFDTGPANTLLDHWSLRCNGQDYDHAGVWAASGTAHQPLLKQMLEDEYFGRPPPKSTGPEYFSPQWLAEKIGSERINNADVQATLSALSARSIADAIKKYAPDCARVIACGGGTRNRDLMRRLGEQLHSCPLETSSAHGIEPDQIEATAFAWLAYRTMNHLSGNIPSVTGASHPVILGGIYPAT
jgi:anhydro-N-acetylmuramic acid kinase